MNNQVLQRLEALQSELVRLDPSREIDVAAQVEAMVRALREVAAEAKVRKPAHSTKDLGRRAAAA